MSPKTVSRRRSVVPATSKASRASKKPVRRRLPPEERREQIVAAARRLFAAGGLDQVSMRNIAREVGITQAAIYQHFQDKGEILFEIIEAFFAELIEAHDGITVRARDPIERMKLFMRAYVENGLARPDEYRLVFMTEWPDIPGKTVHLPEPGVELLTKGQISYGQLHDRMRDLIDAGLVRDMDPTLAAEAVWAAGHGIVALLITHRDMITSPDQLITTQIEMLMNGLLPDDSPARAVRR
jgi:AcrR family transcriptional regulator